MPVTDLQFEYFFRWILAAPRARLDFIWDNLTMAQKNGLTARVKSDLGAAVTAQSDLLATEQTDINSL